MFTIDKQLQKDTVAVADLELCLVQFMNNRYFPWVIMVPKREKMLEISDLSVEDQHKLIEEISFVSSRMKTHFKADKMNVAALGNITKQLHIHVVARFKTDTTWPYTVWGTHAAKYPADQLKQHLANLKTLFS